MSYAFLFFLSVFVLILRFCAAFLPENAYQQLSRLHRYIHIVPFGEISSVRDWLGISGPVQKPPTEIKTRPVLGFDCSRTEVSGKRFWGLLQTLCGTPEKFFKTSFVYNYLPQQWMTASGCNLTPGEFKRGEVQELYNICDPVFSKILELYEVEKIVAIGKFCEIRAKETLKRYPSSRSIQILYLPHPSPRAVKNNKWPETATECLKNYNLLQYYQQEINKAVPATLKN